MATELADKVTDLEPDASWLFGCIASRDVNERNQALQQLETWINEVIVNSQSDERIDLDDEDDTLSSQTVSEDKQAVILQILLQVLRLSIQCPFDDVKSKCSDILISLKVSYMDLCMP